MWVLLVCLNYGAAIFNFPCYIGSRALLQIIQSTCSFLIYSISLLCSPLNCNKIIVMSVVGSLKGSLWASERLLDDIMIRKFVEGVMHEFLQSEVVIKRRANNIILVFLVSIFGDVKKFYFLVGLTEKLLSELLGCVVKVEAQSYSGR